MKYFCASILSIFAYISLVNVQVDLLGTEGSMCGKRNSVKASRVASRLRNNVVYFCDWVLYDSLNALKE